MFNARQRRNDAVRIRQAPAIVNRTGDEKIVSGREGALASWATN